MNALAEREPKQEVVSSDFLSEWIRRGTLLSLILDVGQSLEWPESELKLAPSSGYAFRRLALLTVVTYCYATGLYGSKAIALKASRDETLRFLCAGTFPTWQDIRDFAHHNADLIQQSLIRTCQLAQEYGLQTEAPTHCRGEKLRVSQDGARADLELQFATAADSWIQQAKDSDAIECSTDASPAQR